MSRGRTFASLALTGLLILGACSGNSGLSATDPAAATKTSTGTASGSASSVTTGPSSATRTAVSTNGTGTGSALSTSPTTVTFNKGQAQGAMTGFGWITVGRQDTVSSPTCEGAPITYTSPCTTEMTWMSSNGLCVSGRIAAVPSAPPGDDLSPWGGIQYGWGIQVGVMATADYPPSPLGRSFASVAFNFSGAPTYGSVAVVHLAGDPNSKTFCHPIPASGWVLPLDQFNTACSDDSGQWLGTNSAFIDWVALRVPAASSETTVGLCLESIVFSEGGALPISTTATASTTSSSTKATATASATSTKTSTASATATWTSATASATATWTSATASATATKTVANTSSSVTFSQGKAQGAMTGYGFVGRGSLDNLVSPTCDRASPYSAVACSKPTGWSSDNALCMTGTIPALPVSPTESDYNANWGFLVGVNATGDDPSWALGKGFESITLFFSGTPSAGRRALVHRKGDPAGTVYCYDGVRSDQRLDVTKFNTTCWDGKGKSLSYGDTFSVDWIGLQVSSGSAPITVSNLCLTGIEFGGLVSTATASSTATTTAPATSAATETVVINKGQAVGAMNGWGWVALGSQDSISSPTCEGKAITASWPCVYTTTWSSDNALCITGSIPGLPASPFQSDYDTNWGIKIGVNATADEPTGAIGRSFSSISLKFSGTPTSGLRAFLHKTGEPEGTVYCLDGIKSGQKLDATKFNTACGDGSGKSLSVSDTAKIDKLGLQVLSTASAITVSNLCLIGIEFAP